MQNLDAFTQSYLPSPFVRTRKMFIFVIEQTL